MKIDPSKKYTTRDGRPVEFLHRAPEGWPSGYPWRGVVGSGTASWDDDGRFYDDSAQCLQDLVEVREPLEVLVVVDARNRPAVLGGNAAGWDHTYPEHAPHRIATFREVMP